MLTPVGPERVSNLSFHASWPADARRLLLRAIDRHGGWSLWSRLDSVSLALVSLHGFLPWLKGHGRTFRVPNGLTTYPKRGRTEWRAQPGSPVEAVFDRGDVQVLSPAAHDSRDHRASFGGASYAAGTTSMRSTSSVTPLPATVACPSPCPLCRFWARGVPAGGARR